MNAPEYLAHVRDTLEPRPDRVGRRVPDVQERLLAVPRLGCINIHGALLPRYRGMLPSFWVLSNGERETGVTVHYMSAGSTTGRSSLQRRFPIHADDTLETFIAQDQGARRRGCSSRCSTIEQGAAATAPNNAAQATYYSFPTRRTACA